MHFSFDSVENRGDDGCNDNSKVAFGKVNADEVVMMQINTIRRLVMFRFIAW
jgi:hypothetical protein